MAKRTPKIDPKRILQTAVMRKAVDRIVETAAQSTADIVNLDIQIQQAVGSAFSDAIESVPEVVREPIFIALLITSTASQRKLIAQHPCCASDWVDAAERELARLAEEARKDREAKIAARAASAKDAMASDA